MIKRIKKAIATKKAQRKVKTVVDPVAAAVLEPVVMGAEAMETTPIFDTTQIPAPPTPIMGRDPLLEITDDMIWALRNKSGIVVLKLSSTKLDAFSFGQYDDQFAHEFPSDSIVVDLIQEYTHSICYVRYWTPTKGLGHVYIGKKTKIQELPTTEASEIRNAYYKYIVTNLSQHLGHDFQVGSDPEIFVEDEKGVPIPAFLFLGSKQGKKNLTAPETYGSLPMYWDGFQAEFETSPQNCLAWQVDSVHAGLKGLLTAARAFNPKAKLSARTVMDIPPEMLREAAPEHVAFGCMPSLNAYDLKGLQKDGRDVLFRPAGGHIHFGIGKTSEEEAKVIIKTLDVILGVMCVSLFQKYDDARRRQLYGLPGEYRLPPHGLEYRTISNAWLFHPMIMNLVFDVGRKALVIGKKGFGSLWDATEAEVIECIIKSDTTQAQMILNRNKALFMKILASIYYPLNPNGNDWIFDIILNGMDSVLASPTDIAANWNLDGTWITHSDGMGKNIRLSESIVKKGEKVK